MINILNNKIIFLFYNELQQLLKEKHLLFSWRVRLLHKDFM